MQLLPRFFYIINRLRWRITQPLTLGVRLILEKDRNVLLVKHTYQKHWYLPGGGVEKGETLEEAARREATEELGAKLGPLHLFGVYTNFYEHKNDHVVVFACDDFTLTERQQPRGAARLISREIESVDFFELNALPEHTSPGSLRRLEEYAKRAEHAFVGMW